MVIPQPLEQEKEEMLVPHTVPGPQPMQVVRVGTPPIVIAQPMEALNGIRTGEGDEDILDNRGIGNMADLDVGGSDGSSNMAKKRRIVEEVDENRRCNDLKLEQVVKPVKDNVNNVVNKASLLWSRTLCGSFSGEEQEPDFSLFRNFWKAHGIEIEYIVKKLKGFYIFKFKTDQGTSDALEKGPWTIGDHVQIVFKKGDLHDKPRQDRLPVWIKIYDMPLELWNLEALRVISSTLGIPIAVDIVTRRICEEGSRTARYAGVLVDVGTTGDLIDRVSVSSFNGDEYSLSDLRIEYTYTCLYCKALDHTGDDCIRRLAPLQENYNEMLLKKEEEERRYKARFDIIKVAVARDQDLVQQIGKDIFFDLVDREKVWSFCVEKEMPFNTVKEMVAKEFGVPVECQRFWTLAKRQNRTHRPRQPLTSQEETQSVGQLMAVYTKNHIIPEPELNLFLETLIGPDLRPLPPPDISEEDILVFFKLYDPEKSQLRYVDRLFVRSCGKPTEIISKLNEKAGISPDEEIELYEEIRFEPGVMCERLDKRASFRFSQIVAGDIICFQKISQAQDGDIYEYPDVPSFLEYVKNRQVVRFRYLDRPEEDGFRLELSKLHTYDDVADKVAQKLGLDDASKIRFTPHNKYSNQPEPDSIEYQAEGELLYMPAARHNQVYDITMYYEVLDIPLPELSRLKTLKVAFFIHATTNKEEPVIYNIRLPEQSTVGDVLNDIKIKVKAHPDAELRLLQLRRHMIYKVLTPTEVIENINDHYWTLRAEKIPEEEKDMGPGYQRIHVYHFTKDNQMEAKNFGEPFFMVIRENETLAAVKVRIQHKLEVPDEEFSKWKFAFVYVGSPKYLQDSDIVSSLFQRIYSEWDPPYLGLEHPEQPGCLK